MVELAIRGRKIPKPEVQPKKQFPYAALAGIVALIALIPLIGVLGLPPAGPSLVLAGQSVIGAGPTVIESSCASSYPNDPNLLTVFPIETNSNIDTISLDRNVRLLTVCASGPDGSSGFSHILVPKDILGERVRVTLDGQPVNARVQDLGKYNLVSLDYHHSERIIKITGENEVAPPTPVPTAPIPAAPQQQQQQQVVVTVPNASTVIPLDVCCVEPVDPPTPDPCLPYLQTNSVVGSGIPVIFTPGEKPSFSIQPTASGITVQTSTRAVVNFISDVGEPVGVIFKLTNLSDEPSLIRIRVFSSDSMLVDLIPGRDIDTVRPISYSEYIAQVKGGTTSAELEIHATAITSGFHPFIFEIRPLLEQASCM